MISTGIVALAEIGDKTQLLAFILATRFRCPVPIIAGILVATLLNHGLAGALGTGSRRCWVRCCCAGCSGSRSSPWPHGHWSRTSSMRPMRRPRATASSARR
ncbi:MAG: TMEM165/GDT1 family protein [Steroidobacteraceae bacterium]